MAVANSRNGKLRAAPHFRLFPPLFCDSFPFPVSAHKFNNHMMKIKSLFTNPFHLATKSTKNLVVAVDIYHLNTTSPSHSLRENFQVYKSQNIEDLVKSDLKRKKERERELKIRTSTYRCQFRPCWRLYNEYECKKNSSSPKAEQLKLSLTKKNHSNQRNPQFPTRPIYTFQINFTLALTRGRKLGPMSPPLRIRKI